LVSSKAFTRNSKIGRFLRTIIFWHQALENIRWPWKHQTYLTWR
jgi:hypothetical protein